MFTDCVKNVQIKTKGVLLGGGSSAGLDCSLIYLCAQSYCIVPTSQRESDDAVMSVWGLKRCVRDVCNDWHMDGIQKNTLSKKFSGISYWCGVMYEIPIKQHEPGCGSFPLPLYFLGDIYTGFCKDCVSVPPGRLGTGGVGNGNQADLLLLDVWCPHAPVELSVCLCSKLSKKGPLWLIICLSPLAAILSMQSGSFSGLLPGPWL